MKIRLNLLLKAIDFMMQDDNCLPFIQDRDDKSWLTADSIVTQVGEVVNNRLIVRVLVNFKVLEGQPHPKEDVVVVLGFNLNTKKFEFVDLELEQV